MTSLFDPITFGAIEARIESSWRLSPGVARPAAMFRHH